MMRMAGTRVLLLASVVLVAFAGCGGLGRLDPNPSRNVDLSGTWLLDRSQSDDPQKLMDRLRPKPGSHRGGMGPDDGLADDNGQSAGTGQQSGGQRGGRRSQRFDDDRSYRNNNDYYVRVSVMRTLSSTLARGDQVTVRQTAELFSLDYGTSVRTFTPGGLSVVSAEWGVADQSSGWKGSEFVIEVKPQMGVALVEKYGLSGDGKHLIEQLRLGGGDFPVVEMKRVFDHTDKALPRSFPTND